MGLCLLPNQQTRGTPAVKPVRPTRAIGLRLPHIAPRLTHQSLQLGGTCNNCVARDRFALELNDYPVAAILFRAVKCLIRSSQYVLAGRTMVGESRQPNRDRERSQRGAAILYVQPLKIFH